MLLIISLFALLTVSSLGEVRRETETSILPRVGEPVGDAKQGEFKTEKKGDAGCIVRRIESGILKTVTRRDI